MNEEDVDETTRLMSGEVAHEDNGTSSRDRRPRRQRRDENTDAVRQLEKIHGSSSLLELGVSLCFIVQGLVPRKPRQQ